VPHVAKPSSKRSEASVAVPQPWRSDAKPRAVVERLNGIVETVRPEGYGFIRVYEHNSSVFYHVNQLLDRSRELEVGDEVEFQLEHSERSGKMCCARIKLIAGASSKSSSKRPAPSQLPSKSSKNGRLSPPSAVEPLAKLYKGTVTKVAPEWGYIKVDSLCDDASAPVPKNKLFFNVADVKASRALEMNDAVIFQIGLSDTAGESAHQILLANSSEAQAELLKRSNRGKAESNSKMSDSVSALFAAAANSSKDAYFIRNMQISHDEDREHEFKSLQAARALDDAIASVAPKYINAFLNTAGGSIFFGVSDGGRVHGLTIDRYFFTCFVFA
jgi:cold shock CspA family protein